MASSASAQSAPASVPSAPVPRALPMPTTICPYLDTINRTVLDFDSPDHACSVTLESSPHIYACLVCGRFFRGRGRHTPAYTHSVEEEGGHFVFVHLTEGTFWCLPDGYEVPRDEPSLRDIGLALRPAYAPGEVARLDGNRELARDLFGRRYLPGFVGLNNLKRTDYLNSVVQALAHVRPLRDFFLLAANDEALGNGNSNGHGLRRRPYADFSPLAKSFSLLLRNMWSPHRFKSSVDPHMLVQAVSVASHKRYHVGRQAEAGEFLAWLLHQLHLGVGGGKANAKPSKKKRRKKAGGGRGGSVVHDTFMGRVEVTTATRRRRRRGEGDARAMMDQGGRETAAPAAASDDDDDDRAGSDDEQTVERRHRKRETLRSLADEIIVVEEETVVDTDFLQLTLDIPEKPLFKDEDGGLVIPQEPLVNVLRKFDGVSFGDALAAQQRQGAGGQDGDGGTVLSVTRRYRLRKLPNYLILHLSRFRRNGFTVEKNPTIVMFPVKNFNLGPYVFPEGGKEAVPPAEEVKGMSTHELKALLTRHDRPDLAADAVEKDELLRRCLDFVATSLPDLLADKYDLVANITHDVPVEVGREGKHRSNPLEEGSYRCHVQHKATGQWYEMRDLNVRETMPQLIGVSESYLLIFERKGATAATPM